jgi:hypothetical protein
MEKVKEFLARLARVCYSALRCLPRRDLHLLEKNDVMRALARPHRDDATWHAL